MSLYTGTPRFPLAEVDGVHPLPVEVWEVAAALGFPSTTVAIQGVGEVRIAGTASAWEAFVRRAGPVSRLAAFEALEAEEEAP